VVWPVRSGTVPSLADGFSAREETAADLGAALVTGAVVVLVPARRAGEGPGSWLESCGKTQLAVGVAESLWRLRRVELLVWIAATSRESVLAGFMEAAEATGTGHGHDGDAAAAEFVGWLKQTGRPWLVVLDDLSDLAVIRGLWPAGPAGRVLVTTANEPAICSERGALVHPVGVFSPHEAMRYLMGRLTSDPEKRPGAIDLVTDLGCEPLALAQASGVIVNSAMSCRDYQDCFARRREHAAHAAAAVTWKISAEHADELSQGAARSALVLAALMDGHGIPGTVFTTPAACGLLPGEGEEPADSGRARAALLTVERAGLLTIDLTRTVAIVRMSGVVQAAIRAAMPAGTLAGAATAAADALLQAWPEDDQPGWLVVGLRSCTASLRRATGELLWADGCHPLLLRAGRSLDGAHLTGPAVSYWGQLSAVSSRILGRGHPDTLTAAEQLARAYLRAGRAAEAVSRLRWVLAERIRVLGPDHPGAIATRLSLGHALMAVDQPGEAVKVFDRVAGDSERVRGADQLETLAARDALAAAYAASGQFADAIRLYAQTLSSRESVQGPQHPATMTTRHRLADAYLAADRPKDAISQYKRALTDAERALGPDDPETLRVRAALGSAYQSAGRMAAALQLHEQTRAGYERTLGTDHPDTLASSASLASAYYAVGRVTDAATLLRDTLARSERVLPPGHPLTQAVRQSLANLSRR
jgi:tetratricopeptide (TPR) repeat protein